MCVAAASLVATARADEPGVAAADTSGISVAAAPLPAAQVDTDAFHYERAVVAAVRGDLQTLLENLEAIDLDASPRFASADRAAFLLARAYRDAGNTRGLADLAEKVLAWREQTVFTRWVVNQYLLAQARRPPQRILDLAARWGAAEERTGVAYEDSAAGTAADALAANLLLRNGQIEEAHRLVSRLVPVGDSATLLTFVKSVAAEATDRDADAILRRLATVDTTSAFGRDMAAAARIRLAALELARDRNPIPILSFVSPRSRYASRADHIIGMYEIEHGETASGIARLRRVLTRDPDYPGRRRVLLAVAGDALSRGALEEAGALYDRVDESWLTEQRTLDALLADTPVDSLWTLWRRTARASDVMLLDTVDDDRLLGMIVAATMGQAPEPVPVGREELRYLPPPESTVTGGLWPPPATTPTPSLGLPTPSERLDVEDAAARMRGAPYELARLRWEISREARLLEQRRGYLETGLGRAEVERRLLEARDAELDSVMTTIGALVDRLAGVRDAALRRVAQRTADMLEKSRAHLTTIRALRHLYVEGPESERAEPAPEGVPSASELLTQEEMLATELQIFVEAFAEHVPEIIRRSHDESWTPGIVDEVTRLSALVKERLAWARRIEGDIDASLAALDGSHLDSLRVAASEAESRIEAATRAYDEVRADVARRVVRRTIETIEAEREGVDYGLATMAYVRAVAADENRALDDATVRASRETAIARLTRLLDDYPATAALSEVRFHLADMQLIDAKKRFQSEMQAFTARQGRGEAVGTVPLVDYAPALDLYLAILDEDPDFVHHDAVLYDAGMILADEARTREAHDLLSELVDTYPDSPFVQEAYLKLGDILFDDKMYVNCIPMYEHAAGGADGGFAAIALYKLGWAEFNRDRFVPAADAFRRLMDLYGTERTIDLNTDLGPEAEDYFIHSLVRAGGADAYTEYFARIGLRPYQRDVLLAMGGLLRRYSLHPEAVAVDRLFLAEYPTDPEVLRTVESLISTYEDWQKPDRARELRLELAPAFLPGSEWYEANAQDSLRVAGAAFTRRAWETVALHHHQEAREGHDARANWEAALDLYGTLIRHWPDDADRLHLQAGEAAFNLDRHALSIEHYAEAAASDSLPLARTATWQEMAVTDAWYESTRTGELGADSLVTRVAATVDTYVGRYPDDPRDADLRWRKAGLLDAHGRHREAAAAFTEMLDHHPNDSRAPRAAALAADALHATSDYAAAADAYERAFAVATAAGADTLATRIDGILPGVRLEHAEAMDASPNADRGEVAFLFESIARRWPGFEHASTCQYRAGLAYLADGDVERGLAAMEDVISRFPSSEYVKDAHLQILSACEKAGMNARAADAYVRFADTYPEDPNAGDALLKASDLLETEKRPEEAERLRLRYVDAHPEDAETAMAVLSGLARRELDAVAEPQAISALLDTTTTRSHLARYLSLARSNPDLADRSIRAKTLFLQAETLRPAYVAATLTQPLDASIEAKNARLEPLIAAYRACTDAGVAAWSHASAYRIGEALIQFGEALEASERPKDLEGDDLYAYEDVLFEQAWTFYDRGEGVWTDLLRASGQDDDAGEWVARARTNLWARLGHRFLHRPELEYPLVNATPPPPRRGQMAETDDEATRLARASTD